MNLFDGYDWSGVKVVRVSPTVAVASDNLLVYNAKQTVYQLSVKFHGRTELVYGDKSLVFDTGSILYLPPKTSPDMPYNKYIREGGTGVCIFFSSTNPLPTEAEVIKVSGLPLDRFSKVLQKWREVDGQLACMGEFYKLLDGLKKATASPFKRGNPQKQLLTAKEHIEAHFTDKYIDVDQLARMCGLSAEYFRQSFQRMYGVTPLQHFSGLKLTFAQKLLTESDLPIGVIGMECGFEDANYFARFFARHIGVSPTHYRFLYQKKNKK